MVDTNAALSPLYAQNPLDRFSSRAKDYAHHRPSYPEEAIATLFNGLGQPSELVVADMGAGTGISSRLLADWGATVWAIEPNAAMQAAADFHPAVTFRAVTAEETGLPEQSVDVITCCQSFHWFKPPEVLQEFHRILKPTGRVGLLWNERDLTDEFTTQYTEVVRAASDQEFFDRRDRKSPAALETSPLFTHFRSHAFINKQPLDLDSLIGLVLSKSYTPKAGAAYDQLVADLRTLYEQWTHPNAASDVALSYSTKLYLADPIGVV